MTVLNARIVPIDLGAGAVAIVLCVLDPSWSDSPLLAADVVAMATQAVLSGAALSGGSARQLDAPVTTALTAREREVMQLIALGRSNKEIAARLSIRLPTVKNHVHHILEKLQLHRRGQVTAVVHSFAAP